MAIESTAINELVAGLQQKPLPRESNDWLFGERDDATEIDPRAGEIPSLPRPNAGFAAARSSAQPAPSLSMPALSAFDDPFLRHRSPTTHVRMTDWKNVAKKLALPIAVFSIVIVVLGVYFAKTDETPAPSKAAPSKAAAIAAAPIAAAEQPTPVEKSEEAEILDVKVEVKAEEIEAPVEAPKVEAPKVEAPKVEAPKVEANLNVPPGSPASRFLAPAPVEATIKTADKPSPAPTAVPDLPVPALANPVAARPVATKAAKKSVRQVRAERRAAAQRAAKASVASKARAQKKLAAAEDDGADEPAKPAKAAVNGKGILSIASAPSMEVWVDGRNSNAMTPVRIKLLAGKHKVTLFDKQSAKARSFEIQIKPDETTKITKNYE